MLEKIFLEIVWFGQVNKAFGQVKHIIIPYIVFSLYKTYMIILMFFRKFQSKWDNSIVSHGTSIIVHRSNRKLSPNPFFSQTVLSYCSFGIIKQLLPSYKVNIKVVNPREVVFPRAKALGKTTSLGLTTYDVHLIWRQYLYNIQHQYWMEMSNGNNFETTYKI